MAPKDTAGSRNPLFWTTDAELADSCYGPLQDRKRGNQLNARKHTPQAET